MSIEYNFMNYARTLYLVVRDSEKRKVCMLKMYGTMLCQDCVEAKEHFEKINYKYEFIDITASIRNLKEFLYLRDNRKEFEEMKRLGYVCIPAILTDDNEIILGDDIFEIK